MSEETTETVTEEAPAPEAKVFTQDEVNAIAAKEARKAKESATSGLLSDLGLGSPDDLKAIVAGHREQLEASKTAEQRLAEMEAERATLSEKAGKYEAFVAEQLAKAIDAIPEDKRSLVPDYTDPARQLAYIDQNRALLSGPVAPLNVGTSGSPAASSATATTSYEEFAGMGLEARLQFGESNPALAAQYRSRLHN